MLCIGTCGNRDESLAWGCNALDGPRVQQTRASRASTHSPPAVAAEMSRQQGPLAPGAMIKTETLAKAHHNNASASPVLFGKRQD